MIRNKQNFKRMMASRRTNQAVMEALETRQLFSLVGIGAVLGLPATSIGAPAVGTGGVVYSASTHELDIAGAPISMILGTNPTVTAAVGTPSNFQITLNVDSTGHATSSASPLNDMTMSGVVTINGTTYSGVLLTGQVEAFGYAAGGGSTASPTGNDNFDFQFKVTGGALAAQFFAGKDIGVTLSDENSNFVDFTHDFTAQPVKGYVGSVPPSGNPPINISGHKYLDQSGNGLSSDDTTHPLAGVTIQLFKDSNNNGVLDSGDALAATQVTQADGSYLFAGVAKGTYFVKEVQQSGYVETGPTSGMYTVNATTGTYSGLDFDNFKTDVCPISCIKYTINGCKTVTSLNGNVHQGDTIKVTFTVSEPDQISFVAYTAPNGNFDAANLQAQQIFSVATGTYTKAGTYSLTITVPACYFQVDLVCGLPIDHFGPAGSNIFYHAQQRFIDGDQGGTNCMCTSNASLSGSVYKDCNGDGVRNNNETGIAGVKVTLTGVTAAGNVTLTTTTDANGNYSFGKLAAGTYKVTETDPDGYADGQDSAGSAGGTVANDVISNIVLGANTNAVNYNFGEGSTTNVCGNSGHGGCKVTMSGCDQWGRSCTWSTTCDSQGNYNFGNICSGNWKVQECDSHNNCTATKSFCLDASKWQGCNVNVSTLCGSNLTSLISQILALLSKWF